MDDAAALALELPRAPEAPRIARHQIAESFAARLDQSRLETAALLTSELVTNAVIHGRGSIVLRAELQDDRLLVEVIDEGEDLAPAVGEHRLDRVGGLGLWLVDSEASRWGTHGATTHVWFELEP